ncbi:MAG TPA: 5'-methylthioadenosine/adenosylhomocysteine nucleosidase [Planctomycetota bacterium]|jgi:adenosylhomocysteine nucleosidase
MRLLSLLVFAVLTNVCFCGEEPQAPPQITAIVGAMPVEIKLLEAELSDKQEKLIQSVRFASGKLRGRQVVLVRSGVGKVNAAITTTLLIEHFRPAELIFSGIAGGINPDLQPGDVLIATKTAQHDFGDLLAEGIKRQGTRNLITWKRNPLFYETEPRLIALAETSAARVQFKPIESAAGPRTPKTRKGVIVTGDVFVAAEDKKNELRKALEADAVEMEGAAVAQVCFQQQVPCVVIRSISDLADASAAVRSRDFAQVAAENSARLVMEMAGELVAKEKR